MIPLRHYPQGRYDEFAPGSHPTLNLENARMRKRTESPWNWTNRSKFCWGPFIDPKMVDDAKNENPITIDCWKYGKALRNRTNLNGRTNLSNRTGLDNGADLNDGIDLSNGQVVNRPCTSKVCYIDDKDIENWVKQPIPTQDGELPRAGIRLLHICYDRYPFPVEMLAAVAKAFDIPNVQISVPSAYSGVCATVFTIGQNHPVFICQPPRRNTAVTLVVRYDPELNITVGYILSGCVSQIHRNLLGIPTQFDMCEHPLLLPVIITEHFTEVLGGISFYFWLNLNRTDEIRKDSITQSTPASRDDFTSFARRLSGQTQSFARFKAQLHACILRNDFLKEQLDALDTWMAPPLLHDLENNTSLMRQRIAFNRSNLEHLKLFGGFELSLEALGTLLYNIVTQADNEENIRLSQEMRQVAIKTKKDGSTMKLIAILGAVFLPATFISTFFAMPLFDWNAPTANEILGNHFWIYGVVTGPLTLLTVILVGAWVLVLNRTVNEEHDNANRSELKGVHNGQSDTHKQSGSNPTDQLSHQLGSLIESTLRLRKWRREKTPDIKDEESHT